MLVENKPTEWSLMYKIFSKVSGSTSSKAFLNNLSVSQCQIPSIFEIKRFYLCSITLSARYAVVPRSPVRASPHGSSVTIGGNRSTRRKPAIFAWINMWQWLLQSENCSKLERIRVTVVKDTCTTTAILTPLRIFRACLTTKRFLKNFEFLRF